MNLADKVVYDSPSDLEGRTDLAELCVVKLGITLPAIVDRFDDAVETAYAGWPDRLYVIDRDGRITYKSRPGPFGFKPAEMERAIEQVTSR